MQPPIIETTDFSDANSESIVLAKTPRRTWLWVFIAVDILLVTPLLLVGAFLYVTNQPVSELAPTELTIEPGSSVWEISQSLKNAGIVRSEFTLFLALRYLEDPTQIKASTYNFQTPRSTTEIARTLIVGEFSNGLQSITFVEGMRAQDYAVVAAKLPNVTEAEFLALTTDVEGTLFPETYFVPPDITTAKLVDILLTTHTERISTYREQILANELSVEEGLILASIIEREANTPESMRTVAGIFLNRLAIGMALQADASIEYVIDEPLGELAPGQLATQLRELDSPYNTYLYPGLPPTPIGNPGENAILAIADPIESDYFYYITGDDGEFYYAETYDQHLTNIARHLR
jgi:UPF0755 protein